LQFVFRTRTFAYLNWIHCTYVDAALGAVSCKDVLPSLIFRNYCRRREDGRSEDASRRPFRTVVLAPGMQIIVRRGVCVCVRACVQGGETDPRMQIKPTSHGTPAANELVCSLMWIHAPLYAHITHPGGGLSYLSTHTISTAQNG